MRPITIRRVREEEALQAIKELVENRGFEVISPLRMVTKGRKDFEQDTNKRVKFAGFIENTYWTATLRKVQ